MYSSNGWNHTAQQFVKLSVTHCINRTKGGNHTKYTNENRKVSDNVKYPFVITYKQITD